MSKIVITNHAAKTLVWWFSRKNSIDFDPPYQRRGRLWSERDKSYLIDSILNGFDIPKLYLADFQFGDSPLNERRLPYAIIDGKQRLEAIFDFFENKLVLDKSFRLRSEPTLKLGGLSLKDLRSRFPSVAEEFENANLSIMSVLSDDQALINELFVRLNRSKSLTGAEVRNAINGPVTELIRKISDHIIFEDNIKFSKQRAGDKNAAAKVLYFEYMGDLTSTKKNVLDEFASDEEIDKSQLELAGRRCIDTLDKMANAFIPSDPLLGSAGVFPVYYWFVRGVAEDYLDDVRPFLVLFEEARKAHRDEQKELGAEVEVDQRYARYDTLNRSTNDQTSHVGRVQILRDGFADFVFEEYSDSREHCLIDASSST